MANHIASFSNYGDPDYALPVDKITFLDEKYSNDQYKISKDRYIVPKDYDSDDIKEKYPELQW